MCGFSIFATFQGPIRLHPRTVYRIWAGCFPAIRILVFRGVRWECREHGKPVDNPFERCFAVSGSWHGLTMLPTLSAFGAGLGVGALRTTTALRGFFINVFLGGPRPMSPIPAEQRRSRDAAGNAISWLRYRSCGISTGRSSGYPPPRGQGGVAKMGEFRQLYLSFYG